MDVLAVIPARGGSKGIPGKNIAQLSGRPLIDYSIDAAKYSKAITRIVVSSDANDILRHCESLGVEVCRRSSELAKDCTPTEPVILDVLEQLNANGYQPEWTVILQPTSPLRTAQDIDAAFQYIEKENADGAISVYPAGASPYKAFTTGNGGRLRGLVNDRAPFMRRQDCPPVFYANGAIYILRTEVFVRQKVIGLENVVPFLMPEERSLDIDVPEDLLRATAILEKNND